MEAQLFTLHDQDGAPQLTGAIAGGKLEGAVRIYERGAAQASLQFADGLQDGPSIILYGPHRPMARTHYRAGRLHGPAQFYSPEGKLVRTTVYANGLLHGVQQDFYADGALFEQGAYRMGAREGVWEKYHRNGVVMERRSYCADLPAGAPAWFDERGVRLAPAHP